MRRTCTLILITILLMPFLATANTVQPAKAQGPQVLNVLTAHGTLIYKPIGEAFTFWVKEKYDTEVQLVFDSYDSVTCYRLVTEAGGSPRWSVWWGGGLDPFLEAERRGLLIPFYEPDKDIWNSINNSIPPQLYGLPLKDLDPANGTYNWWGSALSGFGIMVNTEYLRLYGLPEPKSWEDLTKPVYRGHITMCTPGRSGTTHMIAEIILQYYGWEAGWRMLQKIGGNVGLFTEKSYHVPTLVQKGEYGIALVIDFYGIGSILGGYPVEFFYPPKDAVSKTTAINPDCAALLAGAPQRELGEYFMEYILSDDGQKELFTLVEPRMPVRTDVYAEAPEGFFNPFTAEMQVMLYDSFKGSIRYRAINSLYDILITYTPDKLRLAVDDLMDAEARVEEARDRIAAAQAADYNVSAAQSAYDTTLTKLETLYHTMLPVNETALESIADSFAINATFRTLKEAEWATAVVKAYTTLIPGLSTEVTESAVDTIAVLEEAVRTQVATTILELSNAIVTLQQQVGTLQATMNEQATTINELKSTVSTLYTLAGVAAAIGVIGILVGVAAYTKKPKEE